MADKSPKTNKLKARLPRGLADRGPAEIAATRAMTQTIRTVFDPVRDAINRDYNHLQTPAERMRAAESDPDSPDRLYDLGYASIGCEPCTSVPFDPNNPRSGRWSGQKLECGIHIQAK